MDTGVLNTSDGNIVQTEKNFFGQFTRDVSIAGAQAITGLGFKPSALIIIGGRNSGIESSWGFGDENAAQGVLRNREGILTGTFGTGIANITNFVTDGSNAAEAPLTSLDTDGFTITWAKSGSPTGTGTYNFLAFK